MLLLLLLLDNETDWGPVQSFITWVNKQNPIKQIRSVVPSGSPVCLIRPMITDRESSVTN